MEKNHGKKPPFRSQASQPPWEPRRFIRNGRMGVALVPVAVHDAEETARIIRRLKMVAP